VLFPKARTTGRLGSALALGLLASGCAPVEGEPCSVGDEPYVILEGERCAGTLYCSGAPGCDGTPELRWTETPEASGDAPYCDCDGVTWAEPVALNVPNRPWRWYGMCDQPCFEVFAYGVDADGNGDWEKVGGHRFVAPVCTRCEESEPVRADGTCWNPEGVELPRQCCDCVGEGARDEHGDCRGPVGHRVTDTCCSFCERSLPLDADGECRTAEGDELPRDCCDCVGEGVRDANGFCQGPLGTAVAPSCCA